MHKPLTPVSSSPKLPGKRITSSGLSGVALQSAELSALNWPQTNASAMGAKLNVGAAEGISDGLADAFGDGWLLGRLEGESVPPPPVGREGSWEAVTDGSDDDVTDGSDETIMEGSREAVTDGSDDASIEGPLDGSLLGWSEGKLQHTSSM